MLRINQLAKELGVANQEVIEACEKRLGLQGKSHSSNLTDDQADQLRRGFQGKTKGEHEAPPLALHKPSTAVRVVKGSAAPSGESKAEVRPEPQPEAPKPAPAMLVKKAEPKPEPEAPVEPAAEKRATPSETPQAPSGSAVPEAPSAEHVAVLAPVKGESPVSAEPPQETFSRLKVSAAAPASAPRDDKPARYIQLPPTRTASPAPQRPAPSSGPGSNPTPASGPRPEAGARPIVQRPGQSPSHVQRSGMPQKEKAVLQMATNTGRGEVRHEPVAPTTPGRRPYIPTRHHRDANRPGLQPHQDFGCSRSGSPYPGTRPLHPAAPGPPCSRQ